MALAGHPVTVALLVEHLVLGVMLRLMAAEQEAHLHEAVAEAGQEVRLVGLKAVNLEPQLAVEATRYVQLAVAVVGGLRFVVGALLLERQNGVVEEQEEVLINVLVSSTLH